MLNEEEHIMTVRTIFPPTLFFAILFFMADKYITNEVILSWIN